MPTDGDAEVSASRGAGTMRALLIAHTWLACVVVPVVVCAITSGIPADDAARTVVMYMWLPSFVLFHGMLAVYLGGIAPRAVRSRRYAGIWALDLICHALFIFGAVIRVGHDTAGLAANAALLGSIIAYAAAMTAAARAIGADGAS